jgi:hypothetical protein
VINQQLGAQVGGIYNWQVNSVTCNPSSEGTWAIEEGVSLWVGARCAAPRATRSSSPQASLHRCASRMLKSFFSSV